MHFLKLGSVVVADTHRSGEAQVHGFLQAVRQRCLLEEGEGEMYLHCHKELALWQHAGFEVARST